MTQHYTIEKDVPIPGDRRRGRPPNIPYQLMEIGDSIATPMHISTHRYNRDNKHFVCLKVDETTWRTWRTA